MQEGLNELKVYWDYIVTENDKEKIKIKEVTKFNEMAELYAKEIIVKKDRALITTWLNALGEKELLDVYNLMKVIMEERGINVR